LASSEDIGSHDAKTFADRLEKGQSQLRDGANARQPVDCGQFDMRIARDGTWFYRGTPIRRPALVKLFATVLKRDGDGGFWLETPVERGRIDVDDAPFLAIELSVDGQGHDQRLTFRTNLDESVTAGPDHALRVETNAATGEPSPYIEVRAGLEALIARPVYHELVDLGEADPEDDATVGVWSDGRFFPLGQLTEPT